MSRKIIAQLTVGGSVIYTDGSEFFRLFDLRDTFLTATGIDSGNDLAVQDRNSGEIIFQTSNYNAADPDESFADENGAVYATRDEARDAVINFVRALGGDPGAVNTVFGRSGPAITAQFGDYLSNQIAFASAVFVRTLSDFPAPVANIITLLQKTYIIDGTIDMLGNSLNVDNSPAVHGISQNTSILIDSTAGHVMFEGGGTFMCRDLQIQSSGAGSEIFNLTANSSFEAIEYRDMFFNGSAKIGTFSGFRQFLAQSIFVFGATDGITFSGTWAGGARFTDYLVRNSTGTFFKGSIGQTFASRFGSNANIDVPSGSVGYDFTAANFIIDNALQLQNGNLQGLGTYLNGITAESVKSNLKNNRGLLDTFPGGEQTCTVEISTTFGAVNTYTAGLMTTSAINLAHFTSNGSGLFTYISDTPIRAVVTAVMDISGSNANIIGVGLRHFDDSASTAFYLTELDAFLNGGSGGTRADNVTLVGTVNLYKNDTIRVDLKNKTNTNSAKIGLNAKLIIIKIG